MLSLDLLLSGSTLKVWVQFAALTLLPWLFLALSGSLDAGLPRV